MIFDPLLLFKLAMKREVPPFFVNFDSKVLNLGPGNNTILGTINLDYPAWDGEKDRIPWEDNYFDTVLGFHFLEHLSAPGVVHTLREVERVLKGHGNAIFMVPHAMSMMAFQDLDHKTWWTEDTLRILMANPNYTKMQPDPWFLTVQSVLIMGVAARNMALFFQLQKGM